MELLVVIAIIALLAALLLPVLSKTKDQARAIGCLNNLKQLQTCWLMYVHDHDDRVPPNRSDFVMGVWRSSVDSWIGGSSAPFDTDFKPIQDAKTSADLEKAIATNLDNPKLFANPIVTTRWTTDQMKGLEKLQESFREFKQP